MKATKPGFKSDSPLQAPKSFLLPSAWISMGLENYGSVRSQEGVRAIPVTLVPSLVGASALSFEG